MMRRSENKIYISPLARSRSRGLCASTDYDDSPPFSTLLPLMPRSHTHVAFSNCSVNRTVTLKNIFHVCPLYAFCIIYPSAVTLSISRVCAATITLYCTQTDRSKCGLLQFYSRTSFSSNVKYIASKY